MRAAFAVTEGRDGENRWPGERIRKLLSLQSALGFPLAGTSHESRRYDIYSASRARVSKFPPANTATSNNSGRVWAGTMRFSIR